MRSVVLSTVCAAIAHTPAAAADCDDPFDPAGAPVDLHYHEVELRCGEAEPWLAIAVRHKDEGPGAGGDAGPDDEEPAGDTSGGCGCRAGGGDGGLPLALLLAALAWPRQRSWIR